MDYVVCVVGIGSNLESYEAGGITLGEIQRVSRNALCFVLDFKSTKG